MESSNIDSKVRQYFLIQGQSIQKLNDLLNGNSSSRSVKRAFSFVLEIVMCAIFLVLILLAIYIPMDPIQMQQAINNRTSVHSTLHNDDITAIMAMAKAFIVIISLLPLFTMFILRRNRKKNALIQLAYEEARSMKEKFDGAVRDLAI